MPRGVFPRKPKYAGAFKDVARCKPCGWSWRPSSGYATEACPNCGASKDVRKREHAPDVADLNAWRKANPDRAAERSTALTREYRKSALMIVGRADVRCIRCACDRTELLEINHKNGGGAADLKGRSPQFYRDIVTLRRPVDDLELLCRPCNAVHALELLHGPLPFTVLWSPR